MTKAILAAGAVIFLCLSAIAHETPQAEVSAGYSSFRVGGGANVDGWNGSSTGNLNGWCGVTADCSGHYSSGSSNVAVNIPQIPLFTTSVDANSNIHNFLFGGTFSHRGSETLVPFAHALAGF